MDVLRRSALGVVLLGYGLAATAAASQPVTARDAWVRAPAPGQNFAAAYMELVSRSDTLLVSAASPAAASIELHRTTVKEGVMAMRRVTSIELPAGTPVKLAPGGLHAMLIGLKHPLEPGQKVTLTLTVQSPGTRNRSKFTVAAEVRSSAGDEPHRH